MNLASARLSQCQGHNLLLASRVDLVRYGLSSIELHMEIIAGKLPEKRLSRRRRIV